MSRAEEGRALQVAGRAAFVVGGLVLVVMLVMRGMHVGHEKLSLGLAMSFVMLAGLTVTMCGGILGCLENGYDAKRGQLLVIIAGIFCGAGAVTVVIATIRSWAQVPTLNHIGMGMAGAFAIMCGIVLLVEQRIMFRIGAPAPKS